MTSPSPPVEQLASFEDKAQHEEIESAQPGFGLDPAEVAAHAPSLRGRRLTAALAFVAGTGFTLFGYDQGVMSALLTANQFEDTFPQVIVESSHPNHATLQSFLIAIYEVGCLTGALSNLWIGDKLGRRRTIFLGGWIMIIGAIVQTASYNYWQLVAARIFTGFGNGLNTSTVPTYHAECSPAAKRGKLIMLEGSLITFGVTVAYWFDFALYFSTGSSAQWRVPIALQLIFEFIMVICVGFLPESPRWLMKHGHHAEAMAVISALEDKDPSHPEVQRTYYGIREAVAIENDVLPNGEKDSSPNAQMRSNKASLRELLTGGRSQNFRRATIGVVCQMMQQLTGINLITYYATILFQRLGLSDVNSRIMAAANGTEYFLASYIAYALVERVGRRTLMLVGTAGQCVTMLLLAILGSINNGPAQIISAILLFAFNTFFAIGWLGMAWLYCAELSGLRIRAPANALSTASNWTFNFVVVMVVGPSFNNISWKTYIVFAALNAAILPVIYFFFPETGGRSLEDMDVVFAFAYNEGLDPVKVSLRKDIPLAGSPEADEILGVNPGLRSPYGTSTPTTPVDP
ncbi:general substrate transporter [Hygrophoropsis aurantiaca]|uniref:General substrate transporter n=1 Tax=Hygrophoropsis aurantiaca TaxID=72124 RepID=A0ACB8AUE3_9AGAM|nr:general substrate transporter [Hygrophoropsis aurantiaca]